MSVALLPLGTATRRLRAPSTSTLTFARTTSLLRTCRAPWRWTRLLDPLLDLPAMTDFFSSPLRCVKGLHITSR